MEDKQQGSVCLCLNDLVSEEQLLNILRINPIRVEYFPLEEKPYLVVYEENKCTRVSIHPKQKSS